MNNLFLENKYSKWYFSIIEKSQSNNESYLEKHHIIPKSLGGTNLSSNIAKQKLSEIMKKVCNDPAYRAKRGWKPLGDN
jgi:hypothetical protein